MAFIKCADGTSAFINHMTGKHVPLLDTGNQSPLNPYDKLRTLCEEVINEFDGGNISDCVYRLHNKYWLMVLRKMPNSKTNENREDIFNSTDAKYVADKLEILAIMDIRDYHFQNRDYYSNVIGPYYSCQNNNNSLIVYTPSETSQKILLMYNKSDSLEYFKTIGGALANRLWPYDFTADEIKYVYHFIPAYHVYRICQLSRFGDDGRPQIKFVFDESNNTCIGTEYDSKGDTMSMVNYSNRERHGTFVTYSYDNYYIYVYTCSYVNNKRHGIWQGKDMNGNIVLHQEYSHGIPCGKWYSVTDSGEKHFTEYSNEETKMNDSSNNFDESDNFNTLKSLYETEAAFVENRMKIDMNKILCRGDSSETIMTYSNCYGYYYNNIYFCGNYTLYGNSGKLFNNHPATYCQEYWKLTGYFHDNHNMYGKDKSETKFGSTWNIEEINTESLPYGAYKTTYTSCKNDCEKNGILHGTQRAEYKDGKPLYEKKYEYGKPVGSWKYWNSNGILLTEIYFDNECNGEIVSCYDTGNVSNVKMCEKEYTNGLPSGTWSLWKENGLSSRTAVFNIVDEKIHVTMTDVGSYSQKPHRENEIHNVRHVREYMFDPKQTDHSGCFISVVTNSYFNKCPSGTNTNGECPPCIQPCGTHTKYDDNGKWLLEKTFTNDIDKIVEKSKKWKNKDFLQTITALFPDLDQQLRYALTRKYQKQQYDPMSTYDEILCINGKNIDLEESVLKLIPIKKHETYYSNGKMNESGTYNFGCKNGLWESKYKNGKRKSIGNYLNNEKVGKWTFYNRNSSKTVKTF